MRNEFCNKAMRNVFYPTSIPTPLLMSSTSPATSPATAPANDILFAELSSLSAHRVSLILC